MTRTARQPGPARKRPGLLRTVATALLAAAILTPALVGVNPGAVRAQTGFAQGSQAGTGGGTLFADQPQLFAEDGRIKLLVLALNPFGLTESATEQIGLILQKNLNNTGHFDVVGPRETNAAFEESTPELVDCREIACGVEAGKRLGANRVLVGTLTLEDPHFILNVRLIDPANNLTDYENEIRFTDENMDESLFRLANEISRNSVLTGRVVSTSVRGMVVSLGRIHGLELGDHLVVYRQDQPISSLQGEQLDEHRRNLAIVKVLNLNERTSEAIVVHHTEEPQAGQYVQTYLDPQRQIELVENVRRELDVGIRLANRIRPVDLQPVLLEEGERDEWRRQLRAAEAGRDLWFTVGIVGGVATLVVLNTYEDDQSHRLQLALAGGVTGYAFWEWYSSRERVNELRVEGRAKGFLESSLHPSVTPDGQGPALGLALRF